jgi:alcohol dehydrogenase
MCAPVFGACKVFVVDLDASRLAQVAALGAIPINPADGDPIDQIADLNGNLGVDAVIEAVGNEASVATAFSLPKIGGNVAMIGMLVDEAWPLSCGDNWLKEIHVHPVLGNSLGHRSELLSLIAAHRLDPASLISDTFSLDDAAEAYDAFNQHLATKAVLTT